MTVPATEPSAHPTVTEQSVLKGIRQMLGLPPGPGPFDLDVIMGINSALMTLEQLGVTLIGSSQINSEQETWEDILVPGTNLSAAKMFIYLSVRLVFDPPRNGFTVTSFEKKIEELTWRLEIQREYP